MTKKISQNQLFALIFVSRVVVCLTFVQAVSVGKFSADLLISFVFSYLLTVLFSIPILICIKKGINPMENMAIKYIYSLYFMLSSALTVSRFSYFATTKMNPQMNMIVFIVLSFVAVCYGAFLGVEAIGRFGSFCGVLLLFATGFVIFCNLDNFNLLNLYPIFENSKIALVENAILFMSNTIEPALLLVLSSHVEKSVVKPYLKGVSLAFLTIFLLLFFTSGVLGDNGNLQAFPLFALFQMASVSEFPRFDMLHTSFWVLGMFLKSAVLIYVSSSFTSKFNHLSRVIVVTSLTFLMSVIINFVLGTKIVIISKYVTVIMFVALIIVVPTIYCFLRRNAVEKD